jgi:transposase
MTTQNKGERIKQLLKEGSSIAKIVKEVGCERSTVYYHKSPKKKENSLRASYERQKRKNSKVKDISFDVFTQKIKTGEKFICFYSGKEIDLLKDKWAINSEGYLIYIYLKRFNAFESLGKDKESMAINILQRAGYKITKEKAAF